MRASRHISAAATVVLAALACACGPRTLVVVDPDPCADGGTGTGCVVPDPCADGGVLNPGCVPPGLLDDLIGYWQLDDGSGSTMANDLTGRNHGTLVDLDPATAWITARAGGGLNVAAAGFVNVPQSPSINSITDQVTIAGWGYLYTDGVIVDFATIASREEGATLNQYYHIAIDGNPDQNGLPKDQPTCFIKTANGTSILYPRPNVPVIRQTWVHLACTYDGRMAILYVNGQQAYGEPRTGPFVSDMTPVILGANGNGAGDANVTERFPGQIDEIMLYRRALSASEVAMLYAGALFSPRFRDGGARD